MTIVLFLVWMLASLGTFVAAGLAAWRLFRELHGVRGAHYLVLTMIGAVIYNMIAFGLSALAFAAAVRSGGGAANVTLIVFTLGNLAQTVPLILFAFYTIGVFRNGAGDAPNKDIIAEAP